MSQPRPRIFIGSSSEARDVARALEAEVAGAVEVVRWDHVFEASGYALDSLRTAVGGVDFAVLVASGEDTTVSRGTETAAPRDNVVLEFGLCVGILGRTRTFLLATGQIKLPSDVFGLTRLPYDADRSDGDLRGAVSGAALEIESRARALGRRDPVDAGTRPARVGEPGALDRELALLCDNAVAQGWTVRTNSATTLRLRSPRGRTHTLTKRQPAPTRDALRPFVAGLRADGLRVNGALRVQPSESPL